MTTRNRSEILRAVKDDLEGLGLLGLIVIRDSIDHILETDSVPFAVVHMLSTEYEVRSAAVRFMRMTVGITVFADLVEPEWTIVGDGGMSPGILEIQDQLSSRYTPSGVPFAPATVTTFGGRVHTGKIVSHGAPVPVTIPIVQDRFNIRPGTLLRATSQLQLDLYQS